MDNRNLLHLSASEDDGLLPESASHNGSGTIRAQQWAKFSMYGVVGIAGLSITLLFLLGIPGNTTLANWLFSPLLVLLAPISYSGFVMAIARYRRWTWAQLFIIGCCLLATLISIGIRLNGNIGTISSIVCLWLLMLVTFGISFICLLVLRFVESVVHFIVMFRKDDSPPLLRLPPNRWLSQVTLLLWTGLIVNVGMTLASMGTISDTISLLIMREMITTFSGAGASQLWFILVPALLTLLIFTASIFIPLLRSPRSAKKCSLLFAILSFFTFWVEPWISPIMAWHSGLYLEASRDSLLVVGKEYASSLLIPVPVQIILSLVPMLIWLYCLRMIWKAIGQDAVENPMSPASIFSDKSKADRRKRVKLLLRVGIKSYAINLVIYAMIFGFALTLVEVKRFEGAAFIAGILLYQMLIPVFGIFVVTYFQKPFRLRDWINEWELWERASSVWFSHVVVGVLLLPLCVIAELIAKR